MFTFGLWWATISFWCLSFLVRNLSQYLVFLIKSIVKIVRDLWRKFKVKPKEKLETTVQGKAILVMNIFNYDCRL